MKPKTKIDNTALQASLVEVCPHCGGKEFVKRGTRENKLQVVQLFLCKNTECGKTFTPSEIKGRRYPPEIVVETMNYYNLGFTAEQTCALVQQKFKTAPDKRTLFDWIESHKDLCRYERLRPFAVKLYEPRDTVEVVSMVHQQLFRFRYHRAKMWLLLDEYKHSRFAPLRDFLQSVSAETPHQYFESGLRMSEVRTKFNKAEMIVKGKFNYANRLAAFGLRAAKAKKDRHETLQRFFIACDSVTVATEVPVYIRSEDIEYMENSLGFKILEAGEKVLIKNRTERETKTLLTKSGLPRLLTGHVDFIQVRNRAIHLLDYKPDAAKEKPIEQLTWYAMALSRLTGLRLFEFKCGWFDEKDYFEFYPLHVVYKMKSKRRRKVRFKEGVEAVVPKENKLKIVEGKYKKYERALANTNK